MASLFFPRCFFMASKDELLNDINIVTTFSSKYDMKSPALAERYINFFEEKKVFKTQIGIKYLERLNEIKDGKTEELCFVCKKSPSHDGVLCDSCMNKYTNGQKSFYGQDDFASLDELFSDDDNSESMTDEAVIDDSSDFRSETPQEFAGPEEESTSFSSDDPPTWYCRSSTGEITGPYSVGQIEDLSERGEVDKNTKVWREDWKEGFENWLNIGETVLKFHVKGFDELELSHPENSVSNRWLWGYAFAPILFMILDFVIPTQLSSLSTLIAIIINSILFTLDKSYLERNGIKIAKWMWIGFLIVPVYIFARIKKTTKKYAPGIVWIITFALSIAISYFASEINNVNLYNSANSTLKIGGITYQIPSPEKLEHKEITSPVFTYDPSDDGYSTMVFVNVGNDSRGLKELAEAYYSSLQESYKTLELVSAEEYRVSGIKCRKEQYRGTYTEGPFSLDIYAYAKSGNKGVVVRYICDSADIADAVELDAIIRSGGIDPSE